MDVRAEALKKMFIAAYEDLKRSPLYEIRRIEEALEAEGDIFKEFQRQSEIHLKLGDILKGEKLLEFKKERQQQVYDDVAKAAFLKKTEEIQRSHAALGKISITLNEIHQFVYLSLRLKILEEWLRRAKVMPFINAKDEVDFYAITHA